MARSIYSDPFDHTREALKRVQSAYGEQTAAVDSASHAAEGAAPALPDPAKAVGYELFDLSGHTPAELDSAAWTEQLLGPSKVISSEQARSVGAVVLDFPVRELSYTPDAAA